MNTQNTRLQIRHYRYINGTNKLRSLVGLKKAGRSKEIAARGGVTTATVYKKLDGRWRKVDEARAICCQKDNFCRRVGKNMAVGRLTAKTGEVYE